MCDLIRTWFCDALLLRRTRKRPLRDRRGSLLFALCLLLPMLLVPCAQAAPREAAIVIAERGPVQFQRGATGPFRRLDLQTGLFSGDAIQTGPGGEAALLFNDGSRVKLNSNARLLIPSHPADRLGQTLFQALIGVIWAHLRPGQKIQSPSANIVVRGTEVLLDVTPDRTTLTVTEGDVLFANPYGAVDVTASQQSTATTTSAPTPPVAVDVTGLITWTADVVGLPLEFETPGQTGRPDYAAEAINDEAAPRQTPNNPAAWAALGEAKRGQGDLPGALAAFAQAEHLAPDNITARVGTALALLSQGKTADARAALAPVQEQAEARAVLGLADLHDGRGAAAQSDLQAALGQDSTLNSARALLALACLTQNHLAQAEAMAQEAVRRQPDSAQAEGTLALTLFFTGRADAAEAAARRAVWLNPRSPFALLAEGRALLAQGQTDAAQAAYEKAAAIAPYLWLVHQELGTVYLQLDMPQKAAEEYENALRLNPASADSRTGLGVALERQGHFTEAEQAHWQALALAPDNVTAQGNLAALLLERGRLREARQELESGIKTAPERGILYARLAEISLYQQNLSVAQEFAQQAVSLLPDSAVAHYTLGRVYLEQERTVQAEEEFRQATTLDRQFAPARYALGLTEEKTEGGLLSSFSTLLGSALVGSPAAQISLENLLTPGAEQRIQAALLDPTAVRVASRSYGDTQIDAQVGEQDTRDLAASYLTDTAGGRGVRGVDGEEQATNGVRADAGNRRDTANFVFGQKAADSPSAVFVTGQYQDLSERIDNLIMPSSYAAKLRYQQHSANLIAGWNDAMGERSRLRVLIQVSDAVFGTNNSMVADSDEHFHIRSVNSELRYDDALTPTNLFSTGLSFGSRRRQVGVNQDQEALPPLEIAITTKLQPYQAYLRDEARISPKLTLIGEMQLQRLDTFDHTGINGIPGSPPSTTMSSTQKTFGLPNVIVTYQPDARDGIRLRVRRLFATINDFQLLTPTDVFLISFADLPQATSIGAVPTSDGTSEEVEYDHTFANASFLRLGAFTQNIRQADIEGGGPYNSARISGTLASYEGLLGSDLSFFLSGNTSYAQDDGTGLRIAQVPDFEGLASFQYLNHAGFYAQTAYYYQGNRVAADDDRSHLGGFGVLNLRLGKRTGLRSNVYIGLNNAFNKRYDIYGALQPSRQFNIGVSERF